MPEDRLLRRVWTGIGWAGVAAVVVLSLLPNPPQPLPVENADKAEHVLAFCSLMLWFAQIHLSRHARLLIACLLMLLGIAIEFGQGFTGYRSFEYADMGADGIGILLGWLLAPPRSPNWHAWCQRLLLRSSGIRS